MAIFDFHFEDIIDILMPFIIISIIINAFGGKELFAPLGEMAQFMMIQKRRLRNEVKNDGTDRDHLSLIMSAKAIKYKCKVLSLDCLGEKDLISKRIGRIVGVRPGITFTTFVIRTRPQRPQITILLPRDMHSTIDSPEVRIKGRGIENYAEQFYFVTPLTTSEYTKDLKGYWDMCYGFLEEVSSKRMVVDSQGDKDFQVKCGQRNAPDDSLDELKNIKMRTNTETETDDLRER